jgi:hypothetical protein
MGWVLQCEARPRGQHSAASRLSAKGASALLLASFTLLLVSCGGGGGSSILEQKAQVAGNWQFTLTTTGDSFSASPLQGGFLQQNNGTLSGQIAFFIIPTAGGGSTACNNGTATVAGTLNGQTVNLTAVVATLDPNGNPTTQTITLSNGQLSTDSGGRPVLQGGTYGLTAGYATVQDQLVSCGSAQDGGTWSATLVPPATGSFQGFFHSTATGLSNQDFALSGTLTQGPNMGISSATVTGTLVFQDPVSLLNDYPCLTTASVNGTISGNTVLLQIFGTNGADVGQIGQTPGSGSAPTSAVTLDSAQGGFMLHNSGGSGYTVTTKPCPFTDSGNLCLAFQGTNACNQPITLVPFFLTFLPQLLGSAPTTQTITVSNVSGTAITGLQLQFLETDSQSFYPNGGGDFNGVPHFSEQDNCGAQQGTFNLNAGASCVITVSFSPQESCPWLPQTQSGQGPIAGLPPAQCPVTLSADLEVTIPKGSADGDNSFEVPITGTGMSFLAPSVPEIDFGAEAVGEASPPQTLTFTNQSPNRVSILPPGAACVYSNNNLAPPQDRPAIAGTDGGLKVAAAAVTSASILADPTPNPPTIRYNCDTDLPLPKGSGNPNILISNDGCSGVTLHPSGQPGDSCSLQLTFVPQPGTWGQLSLVSSGLDDFVQLNTAWCGDVNDSPPPNCEIDSGRFPVEIKTNGPSPLRMTPGAGMDFGIITEGITSSPLNITLFNDPADPNAATVNFTNKVVSGSDYLETDNCPPSLPANAGCTITVTFTPKVVGLDPGNITITYSLGTQFGLTQTISMRGSGCTDLSTGACVTQNPEFRRRH